MAKSKKLGYSEVNDLSQMSMEDLQLRFYALAQRAEQRQPSIQGQGSGAVASSQQKPDTGFASLDLGDTPYSPDDFQSLTIEQLEEKYLDPATLETRPEYANGAAPERAIMKSPSGSTWERTKLAFTNQPLEKQVKMLEEKYGQGNVALSKGRNITVKENGAWYQLDPSGAGQGSLMDKAYEKTQDILADNADIALSVGVGVATMGALSPLTTGLAQLAKAGIVSGGTALAGSLTAAGASGLASGTVRTSLGRLAGTYEATAEEQIKDIGLEMALSMAGQAFVPGVKYSAEKMGSMWQKAAPSFKGMPEQAKQTFAKVTGTLSGTGEGNMRVILDNAEEYGKVVKQYKGNVTSALADQVTEVQDLTKDVLAGARARAKDLYGKVAEEAGDQFRPSVLRVTQQAGQNIPGEIPVKIDLFDQGIIQKSKGGGLYIDPTKIPVDTPIFGDKKAQKALQPMLDLINDWSKATPKSGQEGVEQLLTFKERLNSTFDAIETAADNVGGLDSALGEIKNFAKQMKEAFINKAIQGPNRDTLVSALNKADIDYAEMKVLTDKFSKAAMKGGKLDRDHYAKLYQNLFEQPGRGTLNAVKNEAGSEVEQLLGKLADYNRNIKPKFDKINIRKSAIATDPWMRPGQASNVQTTAGMVTGALTNPAFGVGVFAAASPKINAKAAQLTANLFRGLDFVKSLPLAQRMEMLKTPEAINKFYSTILSIPGIEAQTGAQLRGMIEGNQNGQ
jgi:hypothetical protein